MSEPKVSIQAAHVSSGSNLPVNRIVIHATCPVLGFPKASAAGQAKATGRYFTSATAGGSAHYVEDVATEEHCVADNRVAWHAPPNPHSIGIEICADGGSAAAYRKAPAKNYTRAQWLSPDVWPAVQRAARRTRELCQRFDIPMTQLSSAEVRADERGICGHVNVSEAFGMTDHSDPGPNFPWVEFMAEVNGTTSKEWFDMPIPDADLDKIADRVWAKILPVIDNPKGQAASTQLAKAHIYAYRGLGLTRTVADPEKFAEALLPKLVESLPHGAVTDDQLRAALRDVLGSLDNTPEA